MQTFQMQAFGMHALIPHFNNAYIVEFILCHGFLNFLDYQR